MNLSKPIFASFIALSAVFSPSAALEIWPQGDIYVGGLHAGVKCFNSKWYGGWQGQHYFAVEKSEDGLLESAIDMPNLSGKLRQNIKRTGENTWRYTAGIELSQGTSPQIALDMTAKADKYAGKMVILDGAPFVFPLQPQKIKDPFNLLRKKTRTAVFLTNRAKVTFSADQPFIFMVQDDRVAGSPTFAVRILFQENRPNCHDITLDIKEEPYLIQQLDLRSAFNSGFSDEKGDDRQGGWTDQGAENDLRMILREEDPCFGDVPFTLVRPGQNDGKSCIVLRGSFRDYFSQSAEAVLPEPVEGKVLYLLHTTAWPTSEEIGDVMLEYTDGTVSAIPVTGQKDVGNWWQPRSCPNGVIAWSGENKIALVGLYRSAFPVDNKPVRKILFRSRGNAVWAIVGATISSERIPEQQISDPVIITANADWKPIRLEKEIIPGSILDFSGRLDAPAGKYGPVVVRDGQFEFRDRPGRPIRFYGTNLVDSAQFMEHEWSERIADRIAKAGFNLVRIHHHDNGLSVRKHGDSTALNEENLDRLNYLIACLKKRGIYITTDCYVSRTFTEQEEAEWGAGGIFAFKHLLLLKRSAIENWKRFTRNWLTASNPYTGMPLKDDPVLISVNLVNEGGLSSSCKDSIKGIKNESYQKWLSANGLQDDPKKRVAMTAAWTMEAYDRSYQEMYNFVRKELDAKVPISDLNHGSDWLFSFARDKYDYIDNHFYVDHPTFPKEAWNLPMGLENVSSIKNSGGDLAWMFSTRIWEKPMMISEFDYAKPNFFRAEGGVLPAAYAGLQDWSGLVQFAYAHGSGSAKGDQTTWNSFDLVSDVVKALSHRIGVKLFLDREIAPAPVVLAAAFANADGMNFTLQPSRDIRDLGLVAQLGTAILPNGIADRDKLPKRVDALLDVGFNFPKGAWKIPVVQAAEDPLTELMTRGILPKGSRTGKIYRATGGQLELNADNQTFRATAPGIEVLILPEKQNGHGNVLAVKNEIGRGIFSVQAVDGMPLTQSKRMLLLHLTDSQASMLKFDTAELRQFSNWGHAPHLAAKGEARIFLTLPNAANYKLYSCDTAGRRLAEIPLSNFSAGKIFFDAKVFRQEGQVFVYELTAQ